MCIKYLELDIWKWVGIHHNQGSTYLCNCMCLCNMSEPPCLTQASSAEWPYRSLRVWGLLLWVQIHRAGVIVPGSPLSKQPPTSTFHLHDQEVQTRESDTSSKCRWTIWDMLNCGLTILFGFNSIINLIFLTSSSTLVESRRLQRQKREPQKQRCNCKKRRAGKVPHLSG